MTLLGAGRDRVRTICRARCDPQPFDSQLPPPRYEKIRDPRGLPPGFIPGESFWTWSHDLADLHGLVLEDPTSFHQAFRRYRSPGVALIVMRGNLPHVVQPVIGLLP